jgi:ribosomal protein S18 acetylase RimI-like enzyme
MADVAMRLVESSEHNIDAVVALWERCGLTRPWNDPRQDFLKAQAAADATVILGYEEDMLVASAMVGYDGHRGWVYYLAVEPSRQRQGHGRALMNAAEQWLRARKAPKLQLMVRETNAAAFDFYERLGFERQQVVTLGKWIDGR